MKEREFEIEGGEAKHEKHGKKEVIAENAEHSPKQSSVTSS